MPLQRSSISKQGGSDLPLLKLLRMIVAVAAVAAVTFAGEAFLRLFSGTFAAPALARCCVRRFNATAAQQHLKSRGALTCGRSSSYASSPPSPSPLTLTHAAACVVSMPLQRSSISKQESAYLPSLKLLRIVIAFTAVAADTVAVADDPRARYCVRRFNAVAAHQPFKAGGL